MNFVTAHDGFTLRDLVSYNAKHNEANGEGSRDGHDHNLSWNGGAEGPTSDPEVRALRARQQRNFLATLFLSQGVPMLCGGDELSRTQRGNNNAYAQDNEVSDDDWAGSTRCLGLRLGGDAIPETDARGRRVDGDTLLILVNAHWEPIEFILPAHHRGVRWEVEFDTADDDQRRHTARPGAAYPLEARSLVVFRLRNGEASRSRRRHTASRAQDAARFASSAS